MTPAQIESADNIGARLAPALNTLSGRCTFLGLLYFLAWSQTYSIRLAVSKATVNVCCALGEFVSCVKYTVDGGEFSYEACEFASISALSVWNETDLIWISHLWYCKIYVYFYKNAKSIVRVLYDIVWSKVLFVGLLKSCEQVGTTFGLLFRVAPGRGIRPSASVRPTGLTQGELVLRGRGCLRPTASDTHQSWGGATNNKKCISPLKGRILLFATSEKVESDEFELSTIVLT